MKVCPYCGSNPMLVSTRVGQENNLRYCIICSKCFGHEGCGGLSCTKEGALEGWELYCKNFRQPPNKELYLTECPKKTCPICGQTVNPQIFPKKNGQWGLFCPNCLRTIGMPPKKKNTTNGQTNGSKRTHTDKHSLTHFCITCCADCGKGFLSLYDMQANIDKHHVIPISKGGPDTDDNIVGLCHECHDKHTKKRESPPETIQYRAIRLGNLTRFTNEKGFFPGKTENTFVWKAYFPTIKLFGYVVLCGSEWTYPQYAATPEIAIALWNSGEFASRNFSLETIWREGIAHRKLPVYLERKDKGVL